MRGRIYIFATALIALVFAAHSVIFGTGFEWWIGVAVGLTSAGFLLFALLGKSKIVDEVARAAIDDEPTFTEEKIVLTTGLLEPHSQPLGAAHGKNALDPRQSLPK